VIPFDLSASSEKPRLPILRSRLRTNSWPCVGLVLETEGELDRELFEVEHGTWIETISGKAVDVHRRMDASSYPERLLFVVRRGFELAGEPEYIADEAHALAVQAASSGWPMLLTPYHARGERCLVAGGREVGSGVIMRITDRNFVVELADGSIAAVARRNNSSLFVGDVVEFERSPLTGGREIISSHE
jgi:hypothetical protein